MNLEFPIKAAVQIPLGGIFWQLELDYNDTVERNVLFIGSLRLTREHREMACFLERLGHYNPLTDPADVFIDEEKALKWLRRGAQPSDTAKRLLSKSGILMKFEYEKLGKPMPGTEIGAEAEEVAKTD